ncbi:MAG: GAF domain-containing protein [Chloroflexota bacterium]|nr:GAF domain-containing protein [Chloroflexota bacterium]
MDGAGDTERELAESRAREAALAEVLAVISRTTADLQPVFETILRKTLELARADTAAILLREGDVFRGVAGAGGTAQEREIDVESLDRGHDFIRPGSRATVTGRVAADGRTVHIPDIALDEDYDTWARELPGAERTLLGVPLFRGREVIGVVMARRRTPRPFSAREIALLEAFAHQAAIAIQNVRLFTAAKESLERQTAISEVLKDMSRSLFDLERVLESVAMNAVRLCAADNGSIAQLKSDGWRLVANVGDIDQEVMERNWGNQPIEPNRRSLTGRVLVDRRTTTIVDAQADPEYDAGVGLFNVRSLIGVPLTRGDEIVGVLILRRREPEPFTPEQIDLLETFADQASIAIENVRLFDETRESLEQQTAVSELLGTISRSAFDLDRVLTAIIERATQLAGADDGTIREVDGNTSRIVASTKSTPPALAAWIASLGFGGPHRQSVTGRVAFALTPVQVPDVDRDPEYTLRLPGSSTRAVLGVPLLRTGELIGVMLLRRNQPGAFSDRQIQLVQTFADQAVIAMENVRLFNETKDQLERETATSEILRVTAQSTFEVQPVLDAVIANATRLAGAENGFVYQVDGGVLRMTAAVGPKAELMREWQRTNPIRANDRGTSTGRAFTEGRTVHIPDVFADPEYKYWEAQRLGDFRTLLTVPLVRQGTTIGVIAMWRTEMKPFTEKEMSLVKTFADQAAIAIANVELFRTVERQREELSRFLSPQVAALITSEQGAKMLEGHRRQITVAFCDLRAFTSFAETAEPEEVLGVLRDYHRAMGEIIVKHQGTLEHFAGDGMMVFFNDPLPVEHHELQAVRMACAMRESFEEMARAWQKRGYELGFGVGIATGYATLGRIGFEGRYDYGAIGNVVILAQRLSAEAKAGQILLSQRVHAAVEADAETTAVGDLTLKGFTRPVPAFAAESVKAPAPAR